MINKLFEKSACNIAITFNSIANTALFTRRLNKNQFQSTIFIFSPITICFLSITHYHQFQLLVVT